MTMPPPMLPLPLSQQIVAWALRALGYGDKPGPGVSRGTLRNAQAGKPIPETWSELVASMLRRLGVKSPPEDLRAAAEGLLRRWDMIVGELPVASGLSLAERLHAPLECAVPEVGIRLGALAASVAGATGTSIDKWLWVFEPLDKCFVGEVIGALFDHRFPGETIEERRARVEIGTEDEERKIIDWRTIERWASGETEVANAKSLAALAEALGEETEAVLRAARLAAVLRERLRASVGDDAMAEWADVVARVGRITARLLRDPGEVASLLRQICEDLEASHGDALHAKLRSLLPVEAKEASRSELTALLAAAAVHIEADGSVDHPVARWIIGCSILLPDPHLEVRVWNTLGGNPLGYLTTKNLSGHIHRDWTGRTLMKAIAHGGTLSFTRSDGAPVERQISSDMQEIARRWETTSLRYRAVDGDDPTLHGRITWLLFTLFGAEGLAEVDPSSFDLLGRVLDPAAEGGLPDDLVRASLPLSLARARRLLKDCDWDGAMRWLPDVRTLRPPWSEADIAGLLATYSEIAHYVLDLQSTLRRSFRGCPVGSDRDQARGVLLDAAQLVERLVDQILQIGKAPEGTRTLLETLVHALPAAIRVMSLRVELEAAQDGASPEAVGRLIEQLKQCLERHAMHGRGWALLALWCGVHDQRKEEVQAERQATHFGAGQILEDERNRLLGDRGEADETAKGAALSCRGSTGAKTIT